MPQFDFTQGDAQMKLFKANGFRMPVVTYCPFEGLNLYYKDEDAMRRPASTITASFIRRRVRSGAEARRRGGLAAGVLEHRRRAGRRRRGPRSAENAEAYRKAFPKGPPFFTAASSFRGDKRDDPHFRLSRRLHVADWNRHDEAGVKLLHEAGGDWAFYNGGNRWTYGVYMYKAAKQYRHEVPRCRGTGTPSAGDPYYALDCREDDYAWCNARTRTAS